MGGLSESESISCRTPIFMHAIPWPLLRFMWETQKWMKWIQRDILPITNTENYNIAFKMEIQKSKIISSHFVPLLFAIWKCLIKTSNQAVVLVFGLHLLNFYYFLCICVTNELLKKIIHARIVTMKWIRKNILPNTQGWSCWDSCD